MIILRKGWEINVIKNLLDKIRLILVAKIKLNLLNKYNYLKTLKTSLNHRNRNAVEAEIKEIKHKFIQKLKINQYKVLLMLLINYNNLHCKINYQPGQLKRNLCAKTK